MHHRHLPGAGFDAPHIELHVAIGSKTDGALLHAAKALAGKLRAMVESGTTRVFEEGQQRPLTYSHIAVLCRASGSFRYYEDAFEAVGVPYLTVAGGGFYDRPEIRDLLNALRALADPTDDLALAGLLRSPACALSDPALYRLDGFRKEIASPATLWQVLQGRGASLPGDDGAAAARAISLITKIHSSGWPRLGRRPVEGIPGRHRLPRRAAAFGQRAGCPQRRQAFGRCPEQRLGGNWRISGNRGQFEGKRRARGRGARHG